MELLHLDNVSLIETHGLMFPVVKTNCLCSLVKVDYDEILCIFLKMPFTQIGMPNIDISS